MIWVFQETEGGLFHLRNSVGQSSMTYLNIPKNDNGQFQNGGWVIPFKKFRRLRIIA